MGRWTRGIDYGAASAARPGKAPPPAWFPEVHHLGLLPGGLREVGFTPAEVEKITSGNWLRLYRDVFGAAQQVRAAAARVRADRSGAGDDAARGRLVSPRRAERIALDVHAHLAPVFKDRLGGIAGVNWNDADGTMTIDGYTLAAKSVYRPEALIAWMDEHRVDRAWISIPPPLYRLGLEARRCGRGFSTPTTASMRWRRNFPTGCRRSITCR